MVKSIIKMLGITLGCSCSAIQAQDAQANNFKSDSLLETVSYSDDTQLASPGDLSVLQDIDKMYAI